MTSPKVSIIVVCFNAAKELGRCLDHLVAQDYPDVEIIVADDGSTDATISVAHRRLDDGRVTIVRSPLNRGCPAARNLGLRHATGDIIAFIDADGFATPNWISEIVRAFADPTVGSVASTVFFASSPLVLNGAGGQVNRAGWAGDIGFGQPYAGVEFEREVLFGMGCGVAIRREVYEQVGPFDARMFNYYDDVDYGLRVWRAGWRVVVSEDAWVDHGYGQSGGDSQRKMYLCERNRMRTVLKHTPGRELPGWAWRELRRTRSANSPRHEIKKAALGWNLRALPSTLLQRWRLRDCPPPPRRLFHPTRGEELPQWGMPATLKPERASSSVDMEHEDARYVLPYGWYDLERDESGAYRWSATHASALLALDGPATGLRLRYRLADWLECGMQVEVIALTDGDVVFSAETAPPDGHERDEEFAVDLPAGRYVVVFTVAGARPDPPAETRIVGVALRRLEAA